MESPWKGLGDMDVARAVMGGMALHRWAASGRAPGAVMERGNPGTAGAVCRGVFPVSYTHLDVYKRQGLANHEPQPTAERFVDLLFPLSQATS